MGIGHSPDMGLQARSPSWARRRAGLEAPRAWPPSLGGQGILSPQKTRGPPPKDLGDLSMDFSIISQNHWIIEVSVFKIVKVSLLQQGIGP